MKNLSPKNIVVALFLFLSLGLTTYTVYNPDTSLDIRNWAAYLPDEAPEIQEAFKKALKTKDKKEQRAIVDKGIQKAQEREKEEKEEEEETVTNNTPSAAQQEIILPDEAPEIQSAIEEAVKTEDKDEKKKIIAQGIQKAQEREQKEKEEEKTEDTSTQNTPSQSSQNIILPDEAPEIQKAIEEAIKTKDKEEQQQIIAQGVKKAQEREARETQEQTQSSTSNSGLCSTLSCSGGLVSTPVDAYSSVCACREAKNVKKQNGSRCNTSSECQSNNCQIAPGGKFCLARGQSITDAKVSEGGICGTTAYNRQCESGLICSSNRCQKPSSNLRCTGDVLEEQVNGVWQTKEVCGYCNSQTKSCEISFSEQSYVTPEVFNPAITEGDPLSLSQNPAQAATFQSEYIKAVERCMDTGKTRQECESISQDALSKGGETGDSCVAYYLLQNPQENVSQLQERCDRERGNAVLYIAAAAYAPQAIQSLANPYVRTVVSAANTAYSSYQRSRICEDIQSEEQQKACNEARLYEGLAASDFFLNSIAPGLGYIDDASILARTGTLARGFTSAAEVGTNVYQTYQACNGPYADPTICAVQGGLSLLHGVGAYGDIAYTSNQISSSINQYADDTIFSGLTHLNDPNYNNLPYQPAPFDSANNPYNAHNEWLYTQRQNTQLLAEQTGGTLVEFPFASQQSGIHSAIVYGDNYQGMTVYRGITSQSAEALQNQSSSLMRSLDNSAYQEWGGFALSRFSRSNVIPTDQSLASIVDNYAQNPTLTNLDRVIENISDQQLKNSAEFARWGILDDVERRGISFEDSLLFWHRGSYEGLVGHSPYLSASTDPIVASSYGNNGGLVVANVQENRLSPLDISKTLLSDKGEVMINTQLNFSEIQAFIPIGNSESNRFQQDLNRALIRLNIIQ